MKPRCCKRIVLSMEILVDQGLIQKCPSRRGKLLLTAPCLRAVNSDSQTAIVNFDFQMYQSLKTWLKDFWEIHNSCLDSCVPVPYGDQPFVLLLPA